jgi:FtsP/CotA-like multicopper oxidase with cupredoxin domain
MTSRQRLTFLAIAAAIAVAAVVLTVTGGGDEAAPEASAPTATATAAPQEASPGQTATPQPTAEPVPLLRAGSERELAVEEGDTVRFRVRAPEHDELHVHGYDITRELPPGETVEVSFEATITGIFEIELHHSGAPLGRLKVEPR